jgi:probable F420-dependent oxidoreductase
VLLGFLAACTTTIELEVAVLVLPQRQTALVAKQAAEVDVLSGGRLVLAVGTGWNHVEYESLGAPFGGRGRRLDEQVDVLRRLWREPVVDYRGEFHRIDRAGVAPRPVRGDIPLWFGGGAEASLRRAAHTGDGFVFGSASPHTHQRAMRLRELLAEQGRDPDGFPMETMIDYSLGPEVWAEQVIAWEASGGSVLSIRTMSTGADYHGVARAELADPTTHITALQEFARVVRG